MEEELVRKAAEVIRREMDTWIGIVVHCMGGIGRTSTVLGGVLRDLGVRADDVVKNYLDRINRFRGARGWPEVK
ncbi:tyrosine-protein phosphatase, partial [Methanosarcina acetivorans]|uniref:Tyrosine specific protein phosphatases domain-containing protein n=1 Tax=Methanosarcina acetivorans (strain ATCC 35395 / DSM 2834 / JCM 12185 / C2A) TaxID=188937 RepID=Q8TNA8_METAC